MNNIKNKNGATEQKKIAKNKYINKFIHTRTPSTAIRNEKIERVGWDKER